MESRKWIRAIGIQVVFALVLSFVSLAWAEASNVTESVTEVILEETDDTDTILEENGDVDAVLEDSTGLALSAKAVILMETSTGTVIYEENADEQLAPASVTKVMTLLLIFDALESGEITLEDTVVVSEYAASMGGSQIFLEVGETQSVETMIKSIVVSSANDACVAMAEHLCGSTELFVEEMNIRAEGLGMTNTNFVNCNGLDTEGHITTARDIGLMSQELMLQYPEITEYTMIWMEDITHVTSSGSSVFGLSNTNRLVQEYAYTTGLKTGSTDEALFCISATASKDDVDLIAVVMAAPTSADRTSDAITLLDYGFAVTKKYEDVSQDIYEDIVVLNGTEDTLSGMTVDSFSYIDVEGNDMSQVVKEVKYDDTLTAPVESGEVVGVVTYSLNEETIGTVEIVAIESMEEMSLRHALEELIPSILLVSIS